MWLRTLTRISGSSPLARGLPSPDVWPPPAPRIIPARAGFTARRESRAQWLRDHPRSRGVYLHEEVKEMQEAGSSPLARGLLQQPRGRLLGTRIIPARAGFTYWRAHHPQHTGDHPRSRGVYEGVTAPLGPRQGSSPLARGLHLRIPGIPTMSHATRPRLPSVPT